MKKYLVCLLIVSMIFPVNAGIFDKSQRTSSDKELVIGSVDGSSQLDGDDILWSGNSGIATGSAVNKLVLLENNHGLLPGVGDVSNLARMGQYRQHFSGDWCGNQVVFRVPEEYYIDKSNPKLHIRFQWWDMGIPEDDYYAGRINSRCEGLILTRIQYVKKYVKRFKMYRDYEIMEVVLTPLPEVMWDCDLYSDTLDISTGEVFARGYSNVIDPETGAVIIPAITYDGASRFTGTVLKAWLEWG